MATVMIKTFLCMPGEHWLEVEMFMLTSCLDLLVLITGFLTPV